MSAAWRCEGESSFAKTNVPQAWKDSSAGRGHRKEACGGHVAGVLLISAEGPPLYLVQTFPSVCLRKGLISNL